MRVAFVAGMLAAIPLSVHAEPFGTCAYARDAATKIKACEEAQKATSYPWILSWVRRELDAALVARSMNVTEMDRGGIALAPADDTRKED
jgi:hypothetical protein